MEKRQVCVCVYVCLWSCVFVRWSVVFAILPLVQLPLFPAALRLGIAFAAQEVEEVPMQPHDIFLHAIATEEGVTRP